MIGENPYLSVFLTGFLVFSGATASYSLRLAGVVSGLILMAVAVYPWLVTRKG